MSETSLERVSRGLRRRYRQLSEAADAGHKPISRQLMDILRSHLRGHPVKMDEYYQYALFNSELFPDEELEKFVGRNGKEWVHRQLNNIRWEGMITDKLMLYTLLDQFDIPHPKVQALICSIERHAGSLPVIRHPDDLTDFLHNKARYPLFSKAVKGSYGRGSLLITGFDNATKSLHLSTGEVLPAKEFLDSCLDGNRFGFLLQDAAQPDPEMSDVVGNLVSGLRMVVLVSDDKATHFRSLWKVPSGSNFIDNFDGGRTGNIIANIDVETGTVTRVFGGNGLGAREGVLHPDNKRDLEGFVLPSWNSISDLVLKAAVCFPDFRWQHWDIGITGSGPIVFELNSAGNTDLVQLASGRGLLDSTLKDFLKKYSR